MTLKYRFLILLSLLVLIYQGCAPKIQKRPKSIIDRYGCEKPPPDVFKAAGVDAKLAELKLGAVVVGGINIKTNPQVISLISKASRNSLIINYLRCLTIKRDNYTLEQANYLDILLYFMQTKPTPDQFMRWQKENSFPKTPPRPDPLTALDKGYSPEQIAYFSQLAAFMQTEPKPTPDQFIQWLKENGPFPIIPAGNRDRIPPKIICSPDIVVLATGSQAKVKYSTEVIDNIDPHPKISYDYESGSEFEVGTTMVTVTAIDFSGNRSACSFKVTVKEQPKVNCNLFLGQLISNKKDWEPLEKQKEWGVEVSYRPQNWPAYFVSTYLASNDKKKLNDPVSGNVNIKGKTSELLFGIKKIFSSSFLNIYPFIGGGLAFINVEVDTGMVHDSDNNLGWWAGAGGICFTSGKFHVGFELKYSHAKTVIFDTPVDAGGFNYGILAGLHIK